MYQKEWFLDSFKNYHIESVVCLVGNHKLNLSNMTWLYAIS